MERRIYERIPLPVKLKYEVINRPKEIKEATGSNISGGGMCIPLKEKLPANTKLTMRIKIGKDKEEIIFEGRVAWNRRVEIEGGSDPFVFYTTGIEFVTPDPINISRVISYFYATPKA